MLGLAEAREASAPSPRTRTGKRDGLTLLIQEMKTIPQETRHEVLASLSRRDQEALRRHLVEVCKATSSAYSPEPKVLASTPRRPEQRRPKSAPTSRATTGNLKQQQQQALLRQETPTSRASFPQQAVKEASSSAPSWKSWGDPPPKVPMNLSRMPGSWKYNRRKYQNGHGIFVKVSYPAAMDSEYTRHYQDPDLTTEDQWLVYRGTIARSKESQTRSGIVL